MSNLQDFANSNSSRTEMLFAELQERVQLALRNWHRATDLSSPLASLHLFQKHYAQKVGNPHAVTNHLLYQALQLLAEWYPDEAELIKRTVLDKEPNDFVAISTNIAESTLYRYKKSATEHLTECLWELELQSRRESSRELLARLGPAPALPLLGIDEHLAHLIPQLRVDGPPWIVALAGIGGIGKTSLADALVRRLVEQGALQALGWMTARQSVLEWDGTLRNMPDAALTPEALVEELCAQLLEITPPLGPTAGGDAMMRLRNRLKAQPHLIVIDNLETVSDLEQVATILRDLAAPTKFLLTTRESLVHQPEIYHYPVRELTQATSIALLRQEAKQRNLGDLGTATDAELLPIFDVVGGNPLALRLVVGQTYLYPLFLVLENLTKAQGLQNESLYTYLYQRAWENLDETTRTVWLTMPLIAPGSAELSRLAEISGLQLAQLSHAMTNLVRLNLVDVHGNLNERRYTIHNLTRTFLHEQVLHWS